MYKLIIKTNKGTREEFNRNIRRLYTTYDKMRAGFPSGMFMQIVDMNTNKNVAVYDTRKGV